MQVVAEEAKSVESAVRGITTDWTLFCQKSAGYLLSVVRYSAGSLLATACRLSISGSRGTRTHKRLAAATCFQDRLLIRPDDFQAQAADCRRSTVDTRSCLPSARRKFVASGQIS